MPYRTIESYDHSGGMNTREAPYLLSSREVAYCQNVAYDEAGKLKTRKGHTNYVTLPPGGDLTIISNCDSQSSGGTWSGHKDFHTGDRYEGTACMRDSVTLGVLVSACDSSTGWSGHDAVDTTDKFEGAASIRDKAVLGEVVENFNTAAGWGGSYVIKSGGYEGYCFEMGDTWVAHKTIDKDWYKLDASAEFSVYLKRMFSTNNPRVRIRFETDANNYYYADFQVGVDGWARLTKTKGQFSKVGSPNWGDINTLRIVGLGSGNYWIDYMYWREKKRGGESATYTASMNFSALPNDAEFSIRFKAKCTEGSYVIKVKFRGAQDHVFFYKDFTPQRTDGWQLLTCKKSDFASSYSPSWSSITALILECTFELSGYRDPGSAEVWRYDKILWREKAKAGSASLAFSPVKNYSSLPDNTEFGMWVKVPTGLSSAIYTLRFIAGATTLTSPPLSADVSNGGWQKLSTTKGAFTPAGSSAWNAVERMDVSCAVTYPSYQDSILESIWNVDYIHYLRPSIANKILGIAEYRKRDGVTVKQVACVGDAVYDLTNTSSPIATGLGGSDYSFAVIGDKLILTNGVNQVKRWDGATFGNCGTGSPWPASDDAPPICKYLCVYANRLWCFGLTASGYQSYLVFGEMGDPHLPNMWPANNWFLIGPDVGSAATGLAVFSDRLVLFTRHRIHILTGRTTSDFQLYDLDDCPGCVAPKSISVSPDGIYYLAQDGVRLLSGSKSHLLSDTIRSTIRESIDQSKMDQAVGVYHDGKYRLWVVEKGGATGGQHPDMALVYDDRLRAWSIWRGLSFNAFGVLDGNLYGGLSLSPSIVRCDTGYDDSGAAIETIIRTRQINCGLPEEKKWFHHLYVVADSTPGDYNLTVTASTERPDEAKTYEIPLTGVDDNVIEDRRTIALHGHYVELEFRHAGVNEPVAVVGYTLAFKSKAVK